jgi:hypothetical protein
MARVSIGDLINMPLPTEPSPDYIPPPPPPLVPGLPADLAADFFSSMTQGGILTNQGAPYASQVDAEFPAGDAMVLGGPTFVATQPNGGLPITPGGRPGFRHPAFMRSPIVPDSMLPPALQRQGLLNRKPVFGYNEYDASLARESRYWEWVREHGGIKTCCRIPELGAPIYSYPPWQVMPSNGIRIGPSDAIFFQPIANLMPFTGTDVLLGSFRCEIGFEGAITHFICGYNGNGFDDGSGNIIWRLKIGQRFAKGLGAVTFTFGNLQTALTVPGSSYRMISGQTVQVFANVPAASPINGGSIFGGFLGWVYPRR